MGGFQGPRPNDLTPVARIGQNDSMVTELPSATAVVPPEVLADLEAVAAAVAEGRNPDPELARRVRERADAARARTAARPPGPTGVEIIREARGPLDDEQERELTLAQRDRVRRGQLRLTDPDTGTTYVLVPADEYDRLRGSDR